MNMEKYEEKNYKVTINDLYVELKKMIENGEGDKPIKLSVNWDNCDYMRNLRAYSTDYTGWLLLMGYD